MIAVCGAFGPRSLLVPFLVPSCMMLSNIARLAQCPLLKAGITLQDSTASQAACGKSLFT